MKDLIITKLNADLHGNVPDKSEIALLLIDVINDLEFDGGERLLQQALPMAKKLRHLLDRAHAEKIPVIYVNDNFGRWRSDFGAQVEHCLGNDLRGRPIAELLQPDSDDYFVLKPKHSGFFSTTLELLLEYLGCSSLILTGMAAEVCVLFTANDAYMRDFRLLVPSDCVASIDPNHSQYALEQMNRVLKADIRPSEQVSFTRQPLSDQD